MKKFIDCIKFANAHPICYLATLDEEHQPRGRMMELLGADRSGFYFQTVSFKDMYNQMIHDPHVEICFYDETPEGSEGEMLRITGQAEFFKDADLTKKTLEERPFLHYLGFSENNDNLVFFRISHGSAHFWTIDSEVEGKQMIKF